MNNFQTLFEDIRKKIEEKIHNSIIVKEPLSIYEPFHYVITAGGKRIRPFLTLISAGAINNDPYAAMDAAIAIEILHNFTLVHDDIMDESPFRRGQPTVHTKWDNSVAILSGDVMVGWAYKFINRYSRHSRFEDITDVFTTGLIEVCEGQAYDMDFNCLKNVEIDDYIKMIDKKTAKILQTSVLLGALIGSCNTDEFSSLSDYAYNFGIAFQLQDDLLDISAEHQKFGKKIGQDIIEGKKTYLIIKAKELAKEPEDIELINKFFDSNGLTEAYVPKMYDLFKKLGILDLTYQISLDYLKKAKNSISLLNNNSYKDLLIWLIDKMENRKY